MKIVFDAGVLIGFSETCLLGLLNEIKNHVGEFIITKGVKNECVDRVKNNMRFKLSALRINDQLDNFVFTVYNNNKELDLKTKKIIDLVNNIYYINNKPLKIIHLGEAESLALLGLTNTTCLAIEERTTRYLIEAPKKLITIFKKKYKNKNIKFNKDKYNKFIQEIGNVKCIRSVDLIAYAYENNLLPNIMQNKEYIKATMYSLKFNGCSISFKEIEDYLKLI
jgi:hypothetical protein